MTERPVALKCRLAFYSLVLGFAVFQTVFASVSIALDGFAPVMTEFSSLGVALAILTWPWVSVLIAFTNRPSSKHVLTRNNVHLFSFGVLSVLWSAMGIMFATQCPYDCNTTKYSDGLADLWCAFDVMCAIFSFIISAFSVSAFLTIYIPRRKEPGYGNINVAAHDVAQRIV